MFIDAIHVTLRDGKVVNRVYTVVGVTVNGERDILGLWVGDGGEGPKYWHQVLSEISTRGTVDVCIVVCDGLRGLPEAVGDVWPRAIVQTCVLHRSETASATRAKPTGPNSPRTCGPRTAPRASRRRRRHLTRSPASGAAPLPG